MSEAILAHFREQAGFCRGFGSPFTGALIDRMGDDLAAGGIIADLVGAWPGAPRADALSLRLAGALHAAVLQGKDAALADAYAAQDAIAAFTAARTFLKANRPWAEDFLRHPPQTNEVRRAIGLLHGFLHLAARFGPTLDVYELGASAGLNQNWDRFRYALDAWQWGDPDAAVRLDTRWQGPPPPVSAPLKVRSRAACDLNPLDVRDPAARLRLKSYIWADQADRLARFDAAADLAIAHDVRVTRADAALWIREQLATRPGDGLAVVYHSVFLQYPPPAVRAAIALAIEEAGARATAQAPLAWLRFEPEPILGGPKESLRFLVDLIVWAGGAPQRQTLAEVDPHGRLVLSLVD